MGDLSQLKTRIEVLEAEKAAMQVAMEAIREQLSIFDSLDLWKAYEMKLNRYGGAEKDMLELAMKANSFKLNYEFHKEIRSLERELCE
ncbi:hypothetical protein SUGI_1086990 [Cryptomeria japonica]|nr:hypothetical protein SUGI_1086990 [Cryptomeria japonica]